MERELTQEEKSEARRLLEREEMGTDRIKGDHLEPEVPMGSTVAYRKCKLEGLAKGQAVKIRLDGQYNWHLAIVHGHDGPWWVFRSNNPLQFERLHREEIAEIQRVWVLD